MSARTSSLSEHLKYSHMLAKLLAGAWNAETGDVTRRIERAVETGNAKAIKRELNKSVWRWSEGVEKKLAKKIAAVVLLTQERARQYWWKERARYTRTKGMTGPEVVRSKAEDDEDEDNEDMRGNNVAVSRSESYQDRVRRLHAAQLTELARRYPERVLSPEIEKLIDFMAEYDTLSETELTRIQTRVVNSLIHPDSYWQGISNVHAARLWHSTGVDMAKAKGVKEMQVVGIWDKRTCPVCKVMIGQVVRVAQVAERLEASLSVEDPDEYVAAWRFPRFNEIQLLDPDALTARGDIPPFHPNCRCSMVWYR